MSRSPEPRRTFLKNGWSWLRVVVIAIIGIPLFRFLGFHLPKQAKKVEVHKRLAAGGFHVTREFVLFQGREGPWAVSRTCTHLGCRLNYSEKKRQLICPCHQSIFNETGKRMEGPAALDLPVFPVERKPGLEGGYVVIIA